ncbi:uncharacterized protein LOC106637599 [Copidosoma floridanum]|uniref:uncharacterized protein LOC106637599 n=1 Tax=Copidosoma floridanum TaxID=29053 RepID=UPI0006C9A115|nr:uncharacterized protein LOC106637599 [Copidosoma floridanum]
MTESTSIIASRNRECTACRVVSGSGLIGAGIYVAYHSQKLNKLPGKVMMFGLAATIGGLGVARIWDLPPFRHQFSTQ